jgi:hypothetical protein
MRFKAQGLLAVVSAHSRKLGRAEVPMRTRTLPLLVLGLSFLQVHLVNAAEDDLSRRDRRLAREYAESDLGLTGIPEDELDAVLSQEIHGATLCYWLLVYRHSDEVLSAFQRKTYFSGAASAIRSLARLGACTIFTKVPGVSKVMKLLVLAGCWIYEAVTRIDRSILDAQYRIFDCLRGLGVSEGTILKWSDRRQDQIELDPWIVHVDQSGWIASAECNPSGWSFKPFFSSIDPRTFYSEAEEVRQIVNDPSEYHSEKVWLRNAILYASEHRHYER